MKLKKRRIFLLILFLAVLFIAIFSRYGSNSSRIDSAELANYQEMFANKTLVIDYQDAESFESSLNAGEDVIGKVVTFTPDKIYSHSIVGYNICAGEHLNFVSNENSGISEDDTVTVVVVKASKKVGSWFIRYELLSNSNVANDLISNTTDFIEDSEETNIVEDDSTIADSTIPVENIIESNDNASITEQVIYNGNNVIIKATSLETTSSCVKLKIYIENNSSLNLYFTAHSYAVNGVMTRNNIYDMNCDVAAGKKANTSIEIPISLLNEFGIDKVKNIDILFWAYDNDENFKSFETDVIHISTSLDDGMSSKILGENIYEANGVSVDYLYSHGDSFTFVITNSTGCYFNFYIENISVNDFTSSDVDLDLYNEQLLNDCQYVFTINLSSDFKSENAITDVKKIEFSIRYEPLDDYSNEKSTDMMGYTF